MAPILEAMSLTKTFGRLVAVDGISVAFREGEVVGIVGTNGSGKTTFINLVTGYLSPTAGAIRFQGADITGLSPRDITRCGIARSFQIPQLFTGMSVIENVLLALAARHEKGGDAWRPLKRPAWVDEAESVLDRFGFEPADRHQQAANLSEGGRKLLDVAMSFALAPKVLLADEPTSGVSARDKFRVMDTLLDVLRHAQVTTVIVEHDLEIIERYAERVLAFDAGRIIADGSVASVLADPAVRAAILGAD